ncbi:arginine--tRNA ligase [Buchnera aphidicola]|uniref:arginine--tRNA ligase n=1 Tax=Buchnera aphidicola TaxID=9 RepID=UPI0031B6A151
MTILSQLEKNVYEICIQLGAKSNFNPNIQKNSQNKNFDYQINGIISLAKILKKNVLKLAKKIIKKMLQTSFYQNLTITKPGFINITLKNEWICLKINKIFHICTFKIPKITKKKIIIDFSSPNIAKEMHVGHLRSTVLGDVTSRILKFLGHHIIKMNHIGDSGTQIGMIITYIMENSITKFDNLKKIYKESQKKFLSNKNFSKKTIECVIKLQNKHPKYLKIWKKLRKKTIIQNQKIYKILKIKLKKKHIFGESFYYHMIPHMLKDLKKKKITIKKNGTIISILKSSKNRIGKKMGVILQKKNGAYLYATTDLACLKYRSQILKIDKIIYYTDIRQTQHLKNIWNIAKKAKYISPNLCLEHHKFGMILSKNKTPFKTREGKTITLYKLIQESIIRTQKILQEKNKNWTQKKIRKISKKIGIGALKYFEISKNRKKNYIFNWNKILTLKGNTSLYIQYAYTRIQSIFKKIKNLKFKKKNLIIINNIYEKKIILQILKFNDILLQIEKLGTPHLLCKYLFTLSENFSCFYEKCPIISEKIKKIKMSRIKIIFLTAKILKKGLQLLGISIVNEM